MWIRIHQYLEPVLGHAFHTDLGQLNLHFRRGTLNCKVNFSLGYPSNGVLTREGRNLDTFCQQAWVIGARRFGRVWGVIRGRRAGGPWYGLVHLSAQGGDELQKLRNIHQQETQLG